MTNGILYIFLLFSTLSCLFKNHSGTKEHTAMQQKNDTITGALHLVESRNKAGQLLPGSHEMFITTGEKLYYIKFCESSVSKEKMQSFTGKLLSLEAETLFGEWDICKKDEMAQSRVGEYIRIFDVKEHENPTIYKYSDGTGNAYLLEPYFFRFIPVSKNESSSLIYDGGPPIKKVPSLENYLKVAHLVQNIIQQKELLTDKRMMTTGQITIECKDHKKSYIILPSPMLDSLNFIFHKITYQ